VGSVRLIGGVRRLEKRMRAQFIVAVASVAYSAQSQELAEYSCSLMYTEDDSQDLRTLETEDFRALDYSEDREFFGFDTPAGMTIVAVACRRSSIIPAPFDDQILMQGYLLYISAGERVVVLERLGGEHRLRLLQGAAFSDSELELINERLRLYDSRL